MPLPGARGRSACFGWAQTPLSTDFADTALSLAASPSPSGTAALAAALCSRETASEIGHVVQFKSISL